MIIFHRRVLKPFLLLLFSCFLVFGNGFIDESLAQTSINGSFEKVGNQNVLNLWGSYYEMGYAHGYLMADKIRDLIDTWLIGVIANGNVSDYNNRLTLIPTVHTFFPQYLDEISGMVDGMNASGKNLYVTSLGRNIGALDIECLNLFVEYWFSCSSFGVWGNSTGNGDTIVARDYDFPYDSQGNLLKDQMLITYEPTGMPKLVSFGWPGWFGVTSGMNEDGIVVMVNSGNGNNATSNGPFHPITETLRYILENTTYDSYLTQPLSIVNSVYSYTPTIILIGSPYQGSSDPVYYIENSPILGALIRWAAYTNPNYDQIIATNHFIEISPPPSSGDTITRYNTLNNGLISLYSAGDKVVDSLESWYLLEEVADIVAPTIMTTVVRPNTMDFDVSFATIVNGSVQTAANVQPQTYTFTSLFPDHGSIIITATAGSGGSISPMGSVSVSGGSNQTFTITSNSGYAISSVLVDGTSVGAVSSYTFTNVTSNHSIAANFVATTTYTITATAGTGGSISPSGSVSVNSGSNQTFTITPNSGYAISSVTVDGKSVGKVGSYTFSNVTAKHTIKASFAVQTYTITATAGTGGTISPSGSVSVSGGSSKTFTITAKSGYTISSVTVDGTSVGAVSTYTFSSVRSNHTIAASFVAAQTYTITATAGTGGSISPSGSVSVSSGSSKTFTITASSGYAISAVTVDGASVGAVGTYTFSSVRSNHTIAASFVAAQTYTITATAGTGGSISPSGSVSVSSGSSKTFTITASSGYAISAVTVDGASVGAVGTYTFSSVSSNHTIAASFAGTGSILTSISVTPSSASVAVNGTQQFTATANDQSGNAMVPQPSFSWTVSGGGTITSSGLFTAGSTAGGPYTVTAASGGVSGTASVTVTAASSFTIGETSILSTNDNGNGNGLIAQQASLGQTGTVVSMSFYVTTAAGSLELGIYDATGPNGGPGTLKARTASFTPVSGWNTANVISQVSLPAGTYWLAYLPSSNSLGFRDALTGSARFYSYTYADMPGTFSTSPTSATVHWSLYATLQPAQ